MSFKKQNFNGAGFETLSQLDAAMSDEYYLQESSHVCGNDMMFWRKNRCGYTTNIDDAQVFTKAEAFEQANRRNTDIPWEKSYIDSKAHRAVNIQNVRFEE